MIWGENLEAGPHTKRWDLKKNGKLLGAGVYYVVITTPEWEKKLLLCIIK